LPIFFCCVACMDGVGHKKRVPNEDFALQKIFWEEEKPQKTVAVKFYLTACIDCVFRRASGTTLSPN